MLIRAFVRDDLARLTELTIDTFRPFFEDSVGTVLDGLVLTTLHADWRDDYRALVPTLHEPAEQLAVVQAAGQARGAYVAADSGHASVSTLDLTSET